MTGSENINICLDAIISSIAVNSAEYAMAHAEPEDYINPTNGLVYCGRCHTPKQCVIRNLRTGGDMTVNCICKATNVYCYYPILFHLSVIVFLVHLYLEVQFHIYLQISEYCLQVMSFQQETAFYLCIKLYL